MANPTVQTGSNGPPAKEKKALIPPEEKFWQRYSPHHEAPLSGASSFFLHISVLLLFALLFWLGTRLADSNTPMPVTAIALSPEGGGGDPSGRADGGKASNQENVDVTPPPTNPAPAPKETLDTVKADPLDSPQYKDSEGRVIDDASEASRILAGLSKDVRQKLFKGLGDNANVAPKGRGGSGMGGGKDKGVGAREGPGLGTGSIEARQQRVLRWTLMFNTIDGNDYKRQLSALGAILAVPEPGGEYRVYRDLTRRPAVGEIEDITKIHKIFWVDDRPDSVQSLARAVGLNPIPPQIVAFFPVELERQLLEMELNYRHRSEHEILETQFRVRREGSNRYVPWVADQRARK